MGIKWVPTQVGDGWAEYSRWLPSVLVLPPGSFIESAPEGRCDSGPGVQSTRTPDLLRAKAWPGIGFDDIEAASYTTPPIIDCL